MDFNSKISSETLIYL